MLKVKKRLKRRIRIPRKTKIKNLKLKMKKRLRRKIKFLRKKKKEPEALAEEEAHKKDRDSEENKDKEHETQGEEEGQKKDKDSEENKDKEPETQGEEEAQKKDKVSEDEDDKTEKLEKTKSATVRRSSHIGTPRIRLVLSWFDEADKYTEEAKQGWILTVCKSNDGASAVDETADEVPAVDEGALVVDEPADEVSSVNETDEGANAVAVDETDDDVPAVDETDEGARDVDGKNERAPDVAVDRAEGLSVPTGVKHRPKAVAVRKNAPKLRGRPRNSTDPKKFTTAEHKTRIHARSRWVSSPFTEADSDEIEGRKKKP
ncbi:unnamed protein product [Eruca vesicaria subsp. sativa]|uniref:Uncharacterized protein n=1 Tax=Eruca vesicaria subsp. sativa TaxID=29727 RepID=A0ABC8J6Z0_ERUVS|nr:unnamed protein product [Eruca vesicaria subsp. sativa]